MTEPTARGTPHESAAPVAQPVAMPAGAMPAGAVRGGLLRWLLQPSVPLWRYCLLAWPLALVPSLLLVFAAFGLLQAFDVDPEQLAPPVLQSSWRTLALVVVFAPVVETLLLALGVRVLRWLVHAPAVVALLSAIGWGLLHGMQSPLWFVGTAWSFFVFSCAWLAWRPRSFGHAFAAAALPHALINATVMATVFLGEALAPVAAR